MARVAFTANLQRHLACPAREGAGETVGAVFEDLFARQPRLRSYLVDDQGRLRRHVAIFVNGRQIADRIRLSDPVRPEDEIFVMQALSGG